MYYLVEDKTYCNNSPLFYLINKSGKKDVINFIKDRFGIDPANPCKCGLHCRPFDITQIKSKSWAFIITRVDAKYWKLKHKVLVVNRVRCIQGQLCEECAGSRGRELDFGQCYYIMNILAPGRKIKTNVR